MVGLGEQWAGSDRERLCTGVCVCAREPCTEPGHGRPLSALPHGIYQPCHSGMALSPCSVDLHLSPDEDGAGFQQCREGAFVPSPSPPLPSPAPPPSCFVSLPSKRIKIKLNVLLFASIGVGCDLADGGVLLEGQQLHTSGSALGKSAWKKPQAQHTRRRRPRVSFSGDVKKKGETKALFNGEVGGPPCCCSPKAKARG